MTKIPEHLADCPITCYFLETKGKITGKWNFMKWLAFLDEDTFKMITESIDKIQSIPAEEFDPDNPSSEGHDIAMLHVYALLEEKYKKVPNNILETLKEEVAAKLVMDNDVSFMLDYIAYEGMRREGNATIKGNGRLLDKNTDVVLTEQGEKMMQKALDSLKDEDDLFSYDGVKVDKDSEYLSVEEAHADFVRNYELEKHFENFDKNIQELESIISNFKKDVDLSKTKRVLYEASLLIAAETKFRLENQRQWLLRTMALCDSFMTYLSETKKTNSKDINSFREKILSCLNENLEMMKSLKDESEGMDFEDEMNAEYDADFEDHLDNSDSGEEWKNSCDKKDKKDSSNNEQD